MLIQQFAKPQHKKQRQKKHNPLFPLGYCWACGIERNLDKHHIFGKSNRKFSEQYGIYVHLCRDYIIYEGNKAVEVTGCHTKVTNELDRELCTRLKQEGQRRFEFIYGHDKFMEIFKRNYL